MKNWNVRINYGIKTGCNEAFIISSEKRTELIESDPNSADIIRPILRGRDIKRYGYEWDHLFIIATFPSLKYSIDDYPAIREYLRSAIWSNEVPDGYGEKKLEQSGKTYNINGVEIKSRKKTSNQWFEVQDQISYWEDFSKQKILWAETMRIHKNDWSNFPRFSYSEETIYTDKTCFVAIAQQNQLYILGFLNSAVGRYLLKRTVSILDNGGFLMQKMFIETICIPTPLDREKVARIEALVKESLSTETIDIRMSIDKLFYEILGLETSEIKYIEDDNSVLYVRNK